MGDTLLDYWMTWVMLPMAVTEESERRWLRVLGVFCVFPWCVPAAMLGMPVVFAGIFCITFEDAWRGPK